MSNKKKTTTIAIPEELMQAIDKEAKLDGRSRSNMIVHRLEQAYRLTAISAEAGGKSANKE